MTDIVDSGIPGAAVMAEAVTGWLEVLSVPILLCVCNEGLLGYFFWHHLNQLKVPKYMSNWTVGSIN